MTIRDHISRGLIFFTGNVAAQGMSAVSGLLLARWLSVSEYAIYTIVFTVMGAMSVLTRGGVNLGFTAILGRTWPDMTRVAQAIQSALHVRRILSAFVLPVILTVTGILLWKNGASLTLLTILLGLLFVFWWADMRTAVVDQVLFFAHQTSRIQLLDTGLAILRLFVVIAIYFAGWLSALSAVIIAALVAVLRVRPILGWINKLLPSGIPARKEADITEITTGVRRQIPAEIFYVFQTQIVLFVLTIFASSTEIAGYGALSRITLLLAPFQALVQAFCVPLFSKAKGNLGRLLILFVVLTAVPGIVLITIAALKPNLLLWLIGPSYYGLDQEILMAVAVAVFATMAGTVWTLIAHRGWVRWSWLQIPIGLGWCAITPFILDLGTINGALMLQGGFSLGLITAGAMDFTHHRRGKYAASHAS